MQITIRADEGKWLTDGENYGKTMSLADGVKIDNFHEITEAEYQRIIEEQNRVLGVVEDEQNTN